VLSEKSSENSLRALSRANSVIASCESTSESTNNEMVAFYHGRNLRARSLQQLATVPKTKRDM
jgi:hypothetical protein